MYYGDRYKVIFRLARGYRMFIYGAAHDVPEIFSSKRGLVPLDCPAACRVCRAFTVRESNIEYT